MSVWGDYMAIRIIKRAEGADLKSQLAAKTRADRQKREAEVALATTRAGARRNDLQPKLQYHKRPISSLKGMNKVRKCETAQVERIVKSLKRFGQCAPVIIRADGAIVDGATMVEAAKQLGFTEIDCVVLEHLTDDETRGLRVTLNKVATLGQFDLSELSIELTELLEIDTSLIDIAFTMPEIDIITHVGVAANDDEKGEGDDDDLPPTPAAAVVSRKGDVWELGKHRVICGDSLAAETYATLMAGASASAIICDPPYNCAISGFVTSNKAHKEFAMAAGEMSDSEFDSFLTTFLAVSKGYAKKGSLVYACIDWRTCHQLVGAGKAAGLRHVNTLVWNKGTGGMGSLYRSAHEMIPVFCNGDKPHTNNIELGKHGRDRTNVLSYAGANRKGSSANKMLGKHPTPKPVELIADLMLDCTQVGDIVLDPFLGSGTMIIAAEKTKRIGYGVELDPGYVDLIVRRWEEHTGKQAVHADSGLSFEQLAAERAADGEAFGGGRP